MNRSIIVADDFYSNPFAVRERALEWLPERESKPKPRFSERARNRLGRLVGGEIRASNNFDSDETCYFDVFHLNQHPSSHYGMPIHHDFGVSQYIGIVY